MQDKKTLLRQKWIEALESGEYEQVRGMFEKPVEKDFFIFRYVTDRIGYCALGVLNQVGIKYGFVDNPFGRISDVEIKYGDIWRDNDINALTFKQIAAKLRQGKYDK